MTKRVTKRVTKRRYKSRKIGGFFWKRRSKRKPIEVFPIDTPSESSPLVQKTSEENEPIENEPIKNELIVAEPIPAGVDEKHIKREGLADLLEMTDTPVDVYFSPIVFGSSLNENFSDLQPVAHARSFSTNDALITKKKYKEYKNRLYADFPIFKIVGDLRYISFDLYPYDYIDSYQALKQQFDLILDVIHYFTDDEIVYFKNAFERFMIIIRKKSRFFEMCRKCIYLKNNIFSMFSEIQSALEPLNKEILANSIINIINKTLKWDRAVRINCLLEFITIIGFLVHGVTGGIHYY